MEASVMFVDCPAHMDSTGSVRCGLPAEVEGLYTMESTDGPLESARIRCSRGHRFNGPVEFLTVPQHGHDRDDGDGDGAAVTPAVAAEADRHLHHDPNPRSAGPRLRQLDAGGTGRRAAGGSRG